ncbi:FAD-dependent monooxygenase [Microlunatus capsulatus]|uniref:2-polyprenyl-6-methoxyphenol hydroxylase-like FAD-dependent oxidoreductase n=1 Tax=Microlunatus capsulatus TaxID=99117 RepID=A0ABS4Z3C6_9ACTN|nr:FAD-dependent monooxygenase [Microlunatus capsulatus]MBP2415540.1 2-polyprenyl-6-methoxyphenol hydroxylase-like FAD-dependent oxidoreductase [Microlunatus capsulatus]
MSTQVLVVGAGPTGLALALSLVRSGVAVRVVDRRPGPAGESRALDVQARTLELYRALGVADRLVDAGVRVRQVRVQDGVRTLAVRDIGDAGAGLSRYPYILCCPQDTHEELLVSALAEAGLEVEFGTTCVGLAQDDGAVTATLRGPAGGLERLEVGYLAGCDGSRSTVRDELGTAYRGTSSDRRYVVADVTATGPAAAPPEQGAFSFCLSRDDFLLVVPARPDGTSRFVGLLPTGLGDDVGFEDVRGFAERTTGTRVGAVHWFSTYGVSHRVAERLRTGRVFLLGDAGHVHSPLGGQGMNTGVGDAVNLGWKLSAVLQGRAPASLLDSYEAERLPFARRLVATTDRVFDRVTGAGRRARLARRLLFRVALPAVLATRVGRRAAGAAVGQIRLRYRGGPLSEGRAGRVRGGDRLPWVDPGDGRDTHAPLDALDWQVHVHGDVRPALAAACAARGLAVHRWPWSGAARAVGLRRHAAYLVRPDGYVALADPAQDPARLLRHLDRRGLRPRPSA